MTSWHRGMTDDMSASYAPVTACVAATWRVCVAEVIEARAAVR